MDTASRRDRFKSAIAVAALHALLGYAFIVGLGVSIPTQLSSGLKLFDVSVEPPPPPASEPMVPEREAAPEPEGAAAPPNLKSVASPVVAPEPVILLPLPPPVIAAPMPAIGNDTTSGAAEVPGPGTGAGGEGVGTGSGARGLGTGGGGRGRPPRWLGGRIRDSDYPRSAFEAGVSGTVEVEFIVAPTGRISECTVTRSSGNADLDATTCRLIMERFRYRPARDSRGKPTYGMIAGEHVWETEQRPDRFVDPVPVEDER